MALFAAREASYISSIAKLQCQVTRMAQLQQLLAADYADLESVLKESEHQRRNYAARYAFVVLDSDSDGYISMAQAESYELFAPYPREVLQYAWRFWRWQSGFPGYLNIEDFVRFTDWCEDRSSQAAQRFWFNVLDADGDGRLGWADCRQAYDAVNKTSAAFVVAFRDLMNQLQDMLGSSCTNFELGFTAGELWRSQLGAGVLGLLTNHNNMLLQRSTAEWGRGEYPL
eukprot:gene4080-4327_t